MRLQQQIKKYRLERRKKSDSRIAVYDENGKLIFTTDEGKIVSVEPIK